MEKKASSLNWKAFLISLVLYVSLLIPSGNAFEFKVGGSRGSWAAPSDPNAMNYNQWAEKNRFQIGDNLLFVYDAGHDSVLHVTKDDYTSCNTAAPIAKFSDGHTVFQLNQSGPFYFISGEADNCKKNQKMVVVVMAARSKHKSDKAVLPPPSPSLEMPPPGVVPIAGGSPPPPGVEVPSPTAPVLTPPALGPVGGGSPPPPVGVAVPPPFPAPSGEEPSLSPPDETPAPSQESPPPNYGTTSTVVNGVGVIAAVVGSWIVVAV